MSALFGNLGGNAPKPAASNLFGTSSTSGAATSGQTGSGLFGTPTATTTTPSLFPPLGASTTSASSSPSLFQSAQPASTGGGLFGGLNTTATTTSGASGLFAPSQPTTTTGGGLFGGLGSSTAPAASAAQASHTGGLLGGSLFGASQQQQPQQAQQLGQSQQQSLSQPDAPKPTQSAYFDHLLERGKKRNNEQNGTAKLAELPSLQLGLGDIARKVRNLGTGGPSAAYGRGAGDTRAHYLLAASGVNTASTLRDLNTFTAQAGASVAPSASRAEFVDTDLDSYVASLRNQSTLDLIAEGLEQSKRDFDAFLEESVQMNWDAQRRRIYEHFGLARKEDNLGDSVNDAPVDDDRGAFGRSSRRGKGFGKSSLAATMGFGASGMARSVIGTPKAGNGRASVFGEPLEKVTSPGVQATVEDRFQRDRQEKFAEEVKKLNVARIQETTFPILHRFAHTEQEAGVDNVQPLVDSYKAVIAITGEKPDMARLSEPGALKERSYREEYREEGENSTSDTAMRLRRRIINGSRQFLEAQFLDHLTSFIAKNPREAQLGGVPSVIDKIRAYVRILGSRKELRVEMDRLQKIKDDMVFVIIYFLLRCGLLDDAKKFVEEHRAPLGRIDRNFKSYIDYYAKDPERRLPPELQQRIATEYLGITRVASEDQDPYRIACYKILGRCDLSRRALDGVSGSWEDWLWLQFSLAREQPRAETSAGETFGLDALREVVKDIGTRHFQAGQSSDLGGYGTYFFLQVLVGLWENGIAWLYQHDLVAAVHFAIAMAYYGLLRTADFSAPQELLTYTTRQHPQLHFGLMLGYYTAPFRTARPLYAVDYLTLIALNADLNGEAGKQQAQLCYEALRELVLETREFAALLGDVSGDGKVVTGAIQQRATLLKLDNDEQFLRVVTMQAAGMAEEAGRVTDAVLLFHLAEQYDAVISICNRALSESISMDLGQEPMRLEPLKPAQDQKPNGAAAKKEKSASLSLTSVEDPEQLARAMAHLYDDAMADQLIKEQNREACQLLVEIAHAKRMIERGRWSEGLEIIMATNLLPLSLDPNGFPLPSAPGAPTSTSTAVARVTSPPAISTSTQNLAFIRDRASLLQRLPSALAHTIPALLLMTLTALSRWRADIQSSPFSEGDATRRGMVKALGEAAKDLMVYAGLVRYKLPGRVFERLGEVIGEDGGV